MVVTLCDLPSELDISRLCVCIMIALLRIALEHVCLPDWLHPMMQIESAILPLEGPSPVGVPNRTGSASGTDASLQHASEKSRGTAAGPIASANVARNRAWSSENRSGARQFSLIEAGAQSCLSVTDAWAEPLPVIEINLSHYWLPMGNFTM